MVEMTPEHLETQVDIELQEDAEGEEFFEGGGAGSAHALETASTAASSWHDDEKYIVAGGRVEAAKLAEFYADEGNDVGYDSEEEDYLWVNPGGVQRPLEEETCDANLADFCQV